MSERARIYVTGMGVVAPGGSDADSLFRTVARGDSAVRTVTAGPEDLPSDILMARATDFDPSALLQKSERMFMARASEMAVVAGWRALAQAGLDEDPGPLADAGVHMGCGLGGTEAIDAGSKRLYGRKTRRGSPLTVPLIMANGPAAHLSMRWSIGGPTLTYSVACSSSALALGEALVALRGGRIRRAVAGGTEAMLSDAPMAAWENLRVLAQEHPDGPEASCRPFDAARTGMVLGEGAAVFVLETEEAMEERGAEPLAELQGYGASSDAHSLTEPHAPGQVAAMRAALADAGAEPGDIGWVNAHATGTPAGDPVELDSLRTVLGDALPDVAISAPKGSLGHLVGAAGAVELLLAVEALRRGTIPPTANLDDPDPAAEGFDLVRGEARSAPGLTRVLSNSFAFGGSNAALVVGRV